MHREKTRTMVLCAMFVVLIAAGAWIKIPVPVVPFTLQYLFTMLAGILYLALGLAGLPIFAQGGGLSYLLQPSFGYLIGFAAGAFVTGTMARSGPVTFRRLLAANLVGLGVVYLFGMLYYYGICQALGTPIGFWPLFLYGFVLAVPGDLVLCVVGAVLGMRLLPGIAKERKA